MYNILGNKLLQTPLRLSDLSWAALDQKETDLQWTFEAIPWTWRNIYNIPGQQNLSDTQKIVAQ